MKVVNDQCCSVKLLSLNQIVNLQIALLVCLSTVVLAAPQSGQDKDAVITKYDSDNIGLGQYNFA